MLFSKTSILVRFLRDFLHISTFFRKCGGNFADFVYGTMSPLLRDVKEKINNQGRSQTSEQDKASFERRRWKARFAWNFFFNKVNLGPKFKTRLLSRLASC